MRAAAAYREDENRQRFGLTLRETELARMIADGEASGKLRPGLTIVDATSGNTGIAYAMVGAARMLSPSARA